MHETYLALLSGGLDSTVATALARQRGRVGAAVTADYGQRSAAREVEASRRIAHALEIPHRVVDLRFLGQLGGNALTDAAKALPTPRDRELTGDAAQRSADAVWVPNRNGLLVNVAAAFAESLGLAQVVVGFNAEEGETFPDNTAAFVDATNRALVLSTRGRVQLTSPTLHLRKREILIEGRRIGAPLEWVWPCYAEGETLCGVCESCVRFERARREAGEAGSFQSAWRSR
ncbi:MAG: 7-cyano-7-deazaguanine synthase QueC [Planctomycetes bacterium]|nr:7-cyano-7-deazaguanine synthase QueC [Planctomycetota bacterium]MBI3846303.1 7-cyano-7-deazaguanine synthase QueC [Planctomycetota bacterium]